MAVKDVKKYCSLVGIEVTFEGNGYVTSYEILEDGTVKLLLNNKWEIG